MKIACAEEPNQPDGNQIDCDDVVQHPGHDQDENPGYQRYHGSKPQRDIHKLTFQELWNLYGERELARIAAIFAAV